MNGEQIDGRRLSELRRAYPLTQGQLETKSGVAQSIISRIERGVITNVRLSTIRQLSDALGVDVRVLMAGELPARPDLSVLSQVRTLSGWDLGPIKDLTPEELEEVLEYARYVLARNRQKERRRERQAKGGKTGGGGGAGAHSRVAAQTIPRGGGAE